MKSKKTLAKKCKYCNDTIVVDRTVLNSDGKIDYFYKCLLCGKKYKLKE